MENNYKEGDILKKDLTSRQSWVVINQDGRLRLQPNTNKYFTDPTVVDFEEGVKYIKLLDIRGMDFSTEICGWSEEAMKYFTPSIEDIRVGYECEYMIGNQFTPFRFSSPYTILGSFSNMQAAIETGHVRVPYLTKEQIEAEGWNHRYNDFTFGVFWRSKNEERNYRLEYDYHSHWLSIEMTDKDDTIIFASKYLGECKDINTFRYICKLLGI